MWAENAAMKAGSVGGWNTDSHRRTLRWSGVERGTSLRTVDSFLGLRARHRAHIVPPLYATPAETEPHSPLRTPVLLGQGAGVCTRAGDTCALAARSKLVGC